MNEMRKIYLRRNTLMSIVFEVLTIICGFILPRYILLYFGSDTNGLVSSITQFLGFISLCELGMGAVVPASLYKPLAENNQNKISSIVVSAQKFYRFIGVLMLIYIAALIVFYPNLVRDSFNFTFTASLIGIVSISIFAQYFFGITYSLLLKADQKQYISFIVNSVTLVLNTLISVALIKWGYSIHTVKLVSAIIFVARPFCLTIYVKKHYALNLEIKYTSEPIKQKWNGIAQHLASTVQEKTDTIILTLFSTLLNVSVYGVYFMVINGMRGLVYSLTAGMSALIGNMLARNEKKELVAVFEKFEWVMHTLTTLIFTITGLLVVPFVQVYTNGISDANDYIVPGFALIMSVAIAARCIQMPYNVVVQAAGHFKETQASAIIEPVVNILISVIMVFKFGLVGVAIGTLVSMIYRVLYLAFYLMKNIIYIKAGSFFKQLLADSMSAFIMVFSVSFMDINVDSYVKWICVAIVITFICGIECIGINIIFYKKYTISSFNLFINKLIRLGGR